MADGGEGMAVDVDAGLDASLCDGLDEETLDDCEALASVCLVRNGEDVFLCERHFAAWRAS